MQCKFFGYEGGEDKLVGIENNLVPQFDNLISSSNYGTKWWVLVGHLMYG